MENMEELKVLADKISQQFALPCHWIKAIIDQESRWNQWAVRYEPNYEWLYNPDKFKSDLISRSTEIQTQKMSWGLGQIMGAVARQQSLIGPLASLLDPTTNITHMCKLIKTLQAYSSDPSVIFATYNGGGGARVKLSDGKFKNQFYVDAIMTNMQKYIK